VSITEIESAITQLPRRELAELISWLREYAAEAWDRQIEEDLAAGRLDRLLSEVDKECEAGLAKPL
jgi:hypothetical protein